MTMAEFGTESADDHHHNEDFEIRSRAGSSGSTRAAFGPMNSTRNNPTIIPTAHLVAEEDIEQGERIGIKTEHDQVSGRNQEIATFAAIAQGTTVDYGSLPPDNNNKIYQNSVLPHDIPELHTESYQTQETNEKIQPLQPKLIYKRVSDKVKNCLFGQSEELNDDISDECEVPISSDSAVIVFIRNMISTLLYDPTNPEFTSTQQFCWACIMGVAMGILTAGWGIVIEYGVEIVWNVIPEYLLKWGVFTDLDGNLPLPYYMIICPSVFGGILSYITVILPTPIPGQNEWIESLHRVGIMDHTTFVPLILISTAGMASGLSLGPELPLVLSAGMVGSFLGKTTHQSILSARVMNLTCAAAAIGGFFGFPMAGALFVLEIPHQMGLQYFEALSPATIASIVAVLVNRICTRNDVHGMFEYPFLSDSLPSHIFYIAIIYGLFGSAVGIAYADGCKKLKMMVHDLFHVHDDHDHHDASAMAEHHHSPSETIPLVGSDIKQKSAGLLEKIQSIIKPITSFGIKHEPTRAAVVGVLAGAATGTIAMFLPHNLFWGEAQLQTLIDKGRTRLPVFGEGDEPTASMTAYGYCMIDEEDEDAVEAGFSTGCMAMIAITKILHIGLSLGTGIVGGHFWGPLFVGAAASHVFIDLMVMFADFFGFGVSVSAYPCVAILCIMGSTHVVTFRAHMAIMLILTLTIGSFSSDGGEGSYLGGDYSAIFPLLVVSCFISLMITRSHIFYKQQRARGDIIASPQVLCEPMKQGMPEYPVHDEIIDGDAGADEDNKLVNSVDGCWAEDEMRESSYDQGMDPANEDGPIMSVLNASAISQADIERDFMATQMATRATNLHGNEPNYLDSQSSGSKEGNNSNNTIIIREGQATDWKYDSPTSEVGVDFSSSSSSFASLPPSKTLDDILAAPIDKQHGRNGRSNKKHKRIKSASDVSLTMSGSSSSTNLSRIRINSADRKHHRSASAESAIDKNVSHSSSAAVAAPPSRVRRVDSYGEIIDPQPSLIDQARRRASSVTKLPKVPPGRQQQQQQQHSRKNSESSVLSSSFTRLSEDTGALPTEDLERSFSSVVNHVNLR